MGCFPEALNPTLKYSRQAVAEGQFWRLFSAHIVHLNSAHSALNVVSIVLCISIFGAPKANIKNILAMLALGLSNGLGLWFFSPEIEYYVGFSGILHSILVYVLLTTLNPQPLVYSAALLGLALKLLSEQLAWFNSFYLQPIIGDAVMVDTHLYRALTGSGCSVDRCPRKTAFKRRR